MTDRIVTCCCIAGGGPAGLMAGLLLARAGIDVVVLEKHADFLRDFRGDTIHPSTLEVLGELGLLQDFLQLPHQEVARFSARFGNVELTLGDFTRLPTRCRFMALMPQWDFLNFLAARAQRYTGFKLYMCAEVTTLTEEAGRVVGVKASTPEGPVEVRADLVIGADGRHSTVRRQAGLEVIELGAPLDVLWFGVSRHASDPADTVVRFERGEILVLINRETHWQCGYVIPKGAAEQVRSRGLAEFQRHIAALVSFLEDRVGEISDWDKVKLLTVAVDRLRRWHRPGLLCIGDAAHAMSPIGGVGINLAIQDAIAAANLLVEPLRLRRLGEEHLSAVQRRREFPTRLTQQLQLFIQRNVIAKALHGTGPLAPPGFLTLVSRVRPLRWLASRLLAIGVRPEHVTP